MVARPRFGLGLVTGVQQPWTAVQTASASACRGLSARAAVESQAKARDGLADRLAAGRSAITDETLVPARRSTRELRLIISVSQRAARGRHGRGTGSARARRAPARS